MSGGVITSEEGLRALLARAGLEDVRVMISGRDVMISGRLAEPARPRPPDVRAEASQTTIEERHITIEAHDLASGLPGMPRFDPLAVAERMRRPLAAAAGDPQLSPELLRRRAVPQGEVPEPPDDPMAAYRA